MNTLQRTVGGDYELLQSGQRTSDPSTSEIRSGGRLGLLITVDVTSVTNTPSVTPEVRAYDGPTGKFMDYWSAADKIQSAGEYQYLLYPGATAQDMTEVQSVPVPHRFKINLIHEDNDAITYSVGYQLIR